MRLAILSDIHGNPLALDAVLDDIQRAGGVDGYWLLGDFAALGYDPVSVLERIILLPNAVFVRGNTDHYVATGERPDPIPDEVRTDPTLLPRLMDVVASFAWTQGYVTAHGWLDWLANLPIEQRLTLPDGTRLLGVHASPGRYDGPGLNPTMGDEEVRARFSGCEADLVVVGHVHHPQDRRLDGLRLVNVGSVSNPTRLDLRAQYVLLTADEAGYQVDFRAVEYDRSAVLDALRRSFHPTQHYLTAFFEGKFTPDWLQARDST